MKKTFVLLLFPSLAAVLATTVSVVGQTVGGDWVQWRGPNRDGSLVSFSEPQNWPERLTQRWKIEIGTGYATPLVVGDRVYAFSRQNNDEVVRAIDAASGKIIWQSSYAAPFRMNPATSSHG